MSISHVLRRPDYALWIHAINKEERLPEQGPGPRLDLIPLVWRVGPEIHHGDVLGRIS